MIQEPINYENASVNLPGINQSLLILEVMPVEYALAHTPITPKPLHSLILSTSHLIHYILSTLHLIHFVPYPYPFCTLSIYSRRTIT